MAAEGKRGKSRRIHGEEKWKCIAIVLLENFKTWSWNLNKFVKSPDTVKTSVRVL